MEKIGNIRVRSEEIGFSEKEMLECGKCGKQNPPNRANCLYCGNALELPPEYQANVKFDLRKPESWEKGFNLILSNIDADIAAKFSTETADSLGISKEMVSSLPEINAAVPIARTEKMSEAELLAVRLTDHGDHLQIVSDEQLAIDKPSTRLRSINFIDGNVEFIDFNIGSKYSFEIDNIRLIVIGSIYESKTSVKEKIKKKSSEIIDEAQTVRDETVIDIYPVNNETGFRIYTSGFDYSCLGSDKGLLAAENILRLAKKLKNDFSAAIFIDDHSKTEELLDTIWPPEIRKDSLGFQQSIFAGRSTENMTTINNHLQFTKFSRLQCRIFNI